MSKLFLFLAFVGIVFAERTCAQTIPDYEQLGKWHNGALSAVIAADPNATEQQQFDIIVAYLEKESKQDATITLAEVKAQIVPYQDLEPQVVFNKLLAEGKINAKQLVWVKKINEIGEKQNEATSWQEITALEVQIKNDLNETDEAAVLAFAAMCRHSGKFWSDMYKGNGEEGADQSKCACNVRGTLQRSCCRGCRNRNWWRIAISDGIPLLITPFCFYFATPPAIAACLVLNGIFAAQASIDTHQARCPCCWGG